MGGNGFDVATMPVVTVESVSVTADLRETAWFVKVSQCMSEWWTRYQRRMLFNLVMIKKNQHTLATLVKHSLSEHTWFLVFRTLYLFYHKSQLVQLV